MQLSPRPGVLPTHQVEGNRDGFVTVAELDHGGAPIEGSMLHTYPWFVVDAVRGRVGPGVTIWQIPPNTWGQTLPELPLSVEAHDAAARAYAQAKTALDEML